MAVLETKPFHSICPLFVSATYNFRGFRRIYKSEEIRKVLKVHTLIMRDLDGKQEKVAIPLFF